MSTTTDTPEMQDAEDLAGAIGGFISDLKRQRDEARQYAKNLTDKYLEASGELQKQKDAALELARELRDALERIASIYENPEPPSMHELSSRAYDMRCIARNAITKAKEVLG
jgi:uncharacterized coiled-coil DUF342 family protein